MKVRLSSYICAATVSASKLAAESFRRLMLGEGAILGEAFRRLMLGEGAILREGAAMSIFLMFSTIASTGSYSSSDSSSSDSLLPSSSSKMSPALVG
jgi:hypothetical protein